MLLSTRMLTVLRKMGLGCILLGPQHWCDSPASLLRCVSGKTVRWCFPQLSCEAFPHTPWSRALVITVSLGSRDFKLRCFLAFYKGWKKYFTVSILSCQFSLTVRETWRRNYSWYLINFDIWAMPSNRWEWMQVAKFCTCVCSTEDFIKCKTILWKCVAKHS